jgi:4'-phosphopantetheinyl transferase
MIGHDEVHVWFASVADLTPATPGYLALLDADERRRALAHRRDEDRDRFIVAHGLRRVVLGEILGCRPEDVAFAARPGGRPRVVRPAGIDVRTSLSHAGGMVALAVSIGSDIGIDIEAVDPRRTDLTVAARYFRRDELARLMELSAAAQPRAFAGAWTRLEAEAKGAGHALEAARRLPPSGVIRAWAVGEDEPGTDHVAALWMRQPATVIEHEPALLASVA